MKAFVLIISIVIISSLFASDSHWEGVILEKILFSVATGKRIVVYTDDKNIRTLVHGMKNIVITEDCREADYILKYLKKSNSLCQIPEIVFNYAIYRKSTNAIAVFFWQKGRPTIRYSAKRLQKFGLEVNGELSKFVSSKN